MALAISLPDTENVTQQNDKYGQDSLKPHNRDINLYTAGHALFAQDGENVLKLN